MKKYLQKLGKKNNKVEKNKKNWQFFKKHFLKTLILTLCK